ncbi:MAG: hypothetical protein ACOZBX_07945, partial [Campylobacterota bacterium]
MCRKNRTVSKKRGEGGAWTSASRRILFPCRIFAVLGAVSPLYAGGEQTISDIFVPGVIVEAAADAAASRTSAGEGTVNARQLEERPLLRPAEVLETVPGLIVT